MTCKGILSSQALKGVGVKINNTLPGLVFSCETAQAYGNPMLIHIGDMGRFSDAVLVGMRRELERLEFVGIPAFARGKLLVTPQGIIQISKTGQASPASPIDNFEHKAREAAYFMARSSDYSFNRAYANKYLPESFYE